MDGEEGFTTPEKQRPEADAESVLRRSIAAVFSDSELSQAEKFARVNALRGLQQQQQTPAKSSSVAAAVVADCPHYRKNCLLQCDKCHEFVACRLCHTELDRFKVAALKCASCGTEQALAAECSGCKAPFATYCCIKCNTYDSTPGKQIFHCDECGICRIGARETVRHCGKCQMCIVGQEVRDHACFENSFRQDCAACLGHLFDSVDPCSVLKCGHAMHTSCLSEIVKSEYRCPICKKAIVDMTAAWGEMEEALDAQMEQIKDEIPQELREKVIKCMCNECHAKYETTFNPFCMYKCPECDGFNTNPI